MARGERTTRMGLSRPYRTTLLALLLLSLNAVALAQVSGRQKRETYRAPPGGTAPSASASASAPPGLPPLFPPTEPALGGELHDEGACEHLNLSNLCVCVPKGAGRWRIASDAGETAGDRLDRDGLPMMQIRAAIVERAVRSCAQTAAVFTANGSASVITPPVPFTSAVRSIIGSLYFDTLCLELGGTRALLVTTGTVGSRDEPDMEPLRAMVGAVVDAARSNRTSCAAPPPGTDGGTERGSAGAPSEGGGERFFPSEKALIASRVELIGFSAQSDLGAALGLSYLNPNVDEFRHAGFAHGGSLAIGYDTKQNVAFWGNYGIGFGVGGKRVALGPLVGGCFWTLSGGETSSFKIPPRPGYFLSGFFRVWPTNALGFELRGARSWLLGAQKSESGLKNQSAYNVGFTHATEISAQLLLFQPDTPKSLGVSYADFGDGKLLSLILGFGI